MPHEACNVLFCPEELTKPMIQQMFGSEAGTAIVQNVKLPRTLACPYRYHKVG